jgi:hypothetical protein
MPDCHEKSGSAGPALLNLDELYACLFRLHAWQKYFGVYDHGNE